MKRFFVALTFLVLIAFAIPIEHKYDKLFRFFSLTLIPEGLLLSGQYDKKIYFYLSDLAALFLLGMGLIAYRIPLRRFFGHPLWFVFFAATLSIVASPFIHYPVAYTRLLQLLTPILLFSFIAYAFSEKEQPQVTRALFLTFFVAALIQSGLAMAQYFHEGPLGLRLFGEHASFATVYVDDHSRWTFDRLLHLSLPSPDKVRAMGTFPHPNVLGGFLALSLLVTYSLFQRAARSKWLFALSIPLQFFALCLTYSRSAFFAWCLGTAVWFFWIIRKKGDKSWRQLGALIALSLLCSSALLYHQILQRGGIVNYNSVAQSSDEIRLYHQNLALKILSDHPLVGLGFGQFSERAQTYFPSDTQAYIRATAPHNVYLFLACETGIPSLLCYLAFLIFLATAAWRLPPTLETASLTSILFAFLFIGCCDFYPILFQQGKLMFFLCAGLLAAHIRLFRSAAPVSRQESWKMFDLLSPHYDRINRILSFGMDQRWRKKVAQFLPRKANLQILDLATGTGDQARALLESRAGIAQITGIDLSAEMLEIAKKKELANTCFLRADAENLPFVKESFDAATFSFGIRNVTSPLTSLKEIHRVLKPQGRCLILEFSLPPLPLRGIYLLYLRYFLPHIGGLLSRQRAAYLYLNRTIEDFPSGKAFCHWMKEAGFDHLRTVRLALGGVTLYIGDKR